MYILSVRIDVSVGTVPYSFALWTYSVEEWYLLGYTAMWFVENQPTFRRNMSSPSSWSKNKQGKKPAATFFTLVSCLVFLRFWKWTRYVPPKSRLIFNGLHGVVSQKRELFIPPPPGAQTLSIVCCTPFSTFPPQWGLLWCTSQGSQQFSGNGPLASWIFFHVPPQY
jgi:hypothetical protein